MTGVGQSVSRPCPCCEGAGCSECDGTGQKVTTYLDAGDGVVMRISGSADLSPEAAEALAALGRAAMNRIGGPDSPGPKGPQRKARSGAERPNPDPASGPLARPTETTPRGQSAC